jgi:hypothetical protein
MIAPIIYWFELERLRRKMRRILKKSGKFSSGRWSATPEEASKLTGEYAAEYEKVKTEIAVLKTNYLLELAERYDVPIPSTFAAFNFGAVGGAETLPPDWSRSPNPPNALFLKDNARRALLKTIRGERQEIHNLWAWLIPLIFGLVGALTGLASIILRK